MFYLNQNLPVWERTMRVVVGIAMLVYGVGVRGGTAGWAIAALGATALSTALVGFCPACAMVGRRPLARGTPAP